jgi:1-phosphatidylinositol-3-phosphate 5-kinase
LDDNVDDEPSTGFGGLADEEELLSKTYKRISFRNLQHLIQQAGVDFSGGAPGPETDSGFSSPSSGSPRNGDLSPSSHLPSNGAAGQHIGGTTSTRNSLDDSPLRQDPSSPGTSKKSKKIKAKLRRRSSRADTSIGRESTTATSSNGISNSRSRTDLASGPADEPVRKSTQRQEYDVGSGEEEYFSDGTSSSSSSSSSDSFDDLGREQVEEDTFNKWFSRPVQQSTDDESSLDDPLSSDLLRTPSKRSSVRFDALGGATVPGLAVSATNHSSSIIHPSSTTGVNSAASKRLGRLSELAGSGGASGVSGTPTSDSISGGRRLQHYKSLSRPHFAVDSSIALPTTPQVKNVRVVSHSLLAAGADEGPGSEETLFSVHESAFRTLSMSHLEHICDILVEKFGLENRWKKIMISFADKAVVNMKINVRSGDHMDVLQYVKVKAIPGGSFDECSYTEGFVFDGNRAKRQMKSEWSNAKVLLLGCSMEYERREGVLLSIDKVLQQEREYLTMLVSKIATAQPNIILVEKNVSLIAQEMLSEKGITLLVNVKPHVLQMVSRLTGATILQSTDHVSAANLGICPNFSIDNFCGPWGEKSCAVVKGPANLFGTIILRGAPENILSRVKQTIQFLIYSAYNMVLENHILYEQTATTVEDASNITRSAHPNSPSRTSNSVSNLHSSTEFMSGSTPTRKRGPSAADPVDPLRNNYEPQNSTPGSNTFKKLTGTLSYDGNLVAASWSVAIPREKLRRAKEAAKESRDTLYHVCPSIPLPPVHSDLKQTCELRVENGTFEVPAPPSPSLNFSYRSLLVPTEQQCPDPDIPSLPLPPKNTRPSMPYLQINHLRKKRVHGIKTFSPQHLIYLHSLYSPATSMQCLPYTPQIIHYYSSNDMTLGQFLENFCFNDRSRCRNEECHRPTSEHERCIMHAEGRINIAVRPFDLSSFFASNVANGSSTAAAQQTMNLDPSKILMWANCKNLQRQTPYMVPMSRESWNFSLGKFFELMFYNAHTRCRTCSEPTYRGHIRYFYFNNKVAMFEYEPIKQYETTIPPMQVSLDSHFSKTLMHQEIDEVVKNAERMYDAVLVKVLDLEDACTKLDDEEELRSITIMHRSLEEERSQFMELVDKERIAVDTVDTTNVFQVTRLRRLFYFNVRRWSDNVAGEEGRVQKKWKAFVTAVKEKERQDAKDRERIEKDLAALRKSMANRPEMEGAVPVPGSFGERKSPRATVGHSGGTSGADLTPTGRSRSGSVDDSNVNPHGGRSRSLSIGSGSSSQKVTSGGASSAKLAAPGSSEVASSGPGSGKLTRLEAPRSAPLSPIAEHTHSSSSSAGNYASLDSGLLQAAMTNTGISSASSTSTSSVASGVHTRERSNSSPQTLSIPIVRPQGSSSQEILFDQVVSPPPAALLVVPQLNYTPHALLASSTSGASSQSTIGTISEGDEDNHVNGDSLKDSPLLGISNLKDASDEPTIQGRSTISGTPALTLTPRTSTTDASSAHPLGVLSSSAPRDSPLLIGTPTVSSPIGVPTTIPSPAPGGISFGNKTIPAEPASRFREALSMVLPQRKTQIVDMMEDVNIYVFPPSSTTEPTVAIYENEPSSIIAYALMSDHYKAKMNTFEYVPLPLNATTSTAPGGDTKTSTFLPPLPNVALVVDLFTSNGVPSQATSASPAPGGSLAPNSFAGGISSSSSPVSSLSSTPTPQSALPNAASEENPLTASGSTTTSTDDSDVHSAISSSTPASPAPAPAPSSGTLKEAIAVVPSSPAMLKEPSAPNPAMPTLTPVAPAPIIPSGPKSISIDSKLGVEMNPMMELAYKGLVSPENTTIDLEWKNTPMWGGPRIQMQCKSYFARQFAWLRSLVGLDEKIFAQSLSRCKPWKARGGKSNSRFARTLDERFILKQVQTIELESFLAFAPLYFDYFSKVYFQQVPTAICKIVGIYSVMITRKGKSPVKVDLIVQENLFYGHHITKTFDLKGSLRSRYARPESPDDKDVVFMDENLLEMMYGDPICVSNEAKAMLAMTVWNDTLCLSNLNVMDYSLLVGVDETNGKLVLGIIDYMRTYTWDKQLETWVKRSGILGGGGSSKIPTIISPKQYKKRFRIAIWAYFLLIPNLNTKLIYNYATATAAAAQAITSVQSPSGPKAAIQGR